MPRTTGLKASISFKKYYAKHKESMQANRRARYVLAEPNPDVKVLYVKAMQAYMLPAWDKIRHILSFLNHTTFPYLSSISRISLSSFLQGRGMVAHDMLLESRKLYSSD